MRRFSSYGPIDKDINFFVPRKELLQKAYTFLTGENPEKGGHYITVWAPRQTGKSWLLRELFWQLAEDPSYHAAKLELEILKGTDSFSEVAQYIITHINRLTGLNLPEPRSMTDFQQCFSRKHLQKPLILILDEFDALKEEVISLLVSSFRNMYLIRQGDVRPAAEKDCLLHGVALIGVRSVVGVKNRSGSPFNVQKSLHIPNLTEAEVNEMYRWYEKESGQVVEQEVIDRLYHVTRGQPGLVSWFGELLTEEYNTESDKPITMKHFENIYVRALQVLPNNTIINIISKARTEPWRQTVLEIFRTDSKIEFRFEKPEFSYLYMNGVISYEESAGIYYARFPCQFIQEKLFDHFSDELVRHGSKLLVDPYIDLSSVINDNEIDVEKLLGLYQQYYNRNRQDLLEYAQRRADMRVMEVVYHFQLYAWLVSFLRNKGVQVLPEFPTGNGKIDLLIRHSSRLYGLELKSFSDLARLNDSIEQASRYGKSLGLDIINLVVFLETPMPEEIKQKYENVFTFVNSASVKIVFLVTGDEG